MNKCASTLALAILGLVALAAASRSISALADVLTTPIVALGITACLVRIVWWLTGPR